ncbi:MAG: chorismate synthase [Bacteroidales bacterium]|nr:chorismate synthase [Bacteroidales bacterium]
MNTFGRKFRISIFGESHGTAIGIVIDGVQPGIALSIEDFQTDILRRKSGKKGTTPRIESDQPEILSGVYNGFTTGAPLAIIFHNQNTRSGDYKLFNDVPRPGHADYTASIKWLDFNDPRGGGHFSGRITLPVVAAGVVAKKMLGFNIGAQLIEVGGVSRAKALASRPEAALPDGGVEEKEELSDSQIWSDVLDEAIREQDSVGGIVECTVNGVPAGLGEPFFDSVEALVSHAIFSIPGVRGIEFGDGFESARMKGSVHNDPFDEIGSGNLNLHVNVRPSKNGAGGINGGITNGNPIVFRVAFKPTSSIGKAQKTFNFATGEMTELEIPGRHDACIALRTPVIVEAMTAIVLADLTRML